MTDAPAPAASVDRSAQRQKALRIFGLVVGTLALLWLAYYLLVGRNHISTDNAYVGADIAQVTPLIAGTISDVRVADTAQVKKGDVLVRLDNSDTKLALASAEAALAHARRSVAQSLATSGGLSAEVLGAQAALEKARSDYARRAPLAGTGAVSQEELTSAANALRMAEARLEAARQQLAASLAMTEGTTVESHPDVAAARARRDAARLDYQRTVLRAPMDGVIARRQAQVGQRVAPGAVLMWVVPVGQVYVDANFKEGQLARVRIGQSAELTSDLYGGDVVYHGKVVGLGGGTGSAFALIPAQNATGNWIKVVQRLPVRIALDPKELAAHPLRVGLSMDVRIDVKDAR